LQLLVGTSLSFTTEYLYHICTKMHRCFFF